MKKYSLLFLAASLAVISFIPTSCAEINGHRKTQMSDRDIFYSARKRMVDGQIRSRGIKNPGVLEAMEKVPRHLFVPPRQRQFAYEDRALPIEEGQTISQPYIVALMTELIDPGKEDRVLEIGTGSGYQAAILAELCSAVYTIEIIEPLAESARSLLKKQGYDNIEVRAGDGFKGWPQQAPFDSIIVTAAPPAIPPPLLEQLAEGGRMVIPVGPQWKWQELYLVKKKEGKIIKEKIAPVAFVPMTGDGVKSLGEE
jgi:protein-L-isoaspartate(D-aspartate) O-methyltransferase